MLCVVDSGTASSTMEDQGSMGYLKSAVHIWLAARACCTSAALSACTCQHGQGWVGFCGKRGEERAACANLHTSH